MSKLKNFYPYAFNLDFFDDGKYSQYVNNVVQQVQQISQDQTVILYWYEPRSLKNVLYTIEEVGRKCDQKIVWILTDSFYDTAQKEKIQSTGVDVTFIEFDLLNLYFELNVYRTSQLNTTWNCTANQFLFLTGKPNRPNRLRLLYKFYQQGLLDHTVWSLFMDNNLRKKCRYLLPEIDDQEYADFIDNYISNPDNVNVIYGSGNSCHYDGYPFDSLLYKQTAFRVISETQMLDRAIVTEKTWTTVANRQPFIIAGFQHNLLPLQDKGYRTFEKYLKVPEYDSIDSQEYRLNAVVENTKYWLSNIQHYQTQIADDIEYNFRLLTEQMNKTFAQFSSIYRKLGNIEFEIFRVITTSIQRANWINFYYAIKNPSWPNCFGEEQFGLLPDIVQKECIEVHGYSKLK